MLNILKKAGGRIKKHMTEKMEFCREFMGSAQNRLVLGLIIMGLGCGLGGGLITSAYIKVPE